MSDFSELLSRHINKSGLTEMQLAKISGFTRSYIALMKNGHRVSPDTEKMEKLLTALSLTEGEYDAVWEAYQKSRYGDYTYMMQKKVIAFLEGFGKFPELTIPSDQVYEIPNVTVLDKRADLEVFVKAVIEQEGHVAGGHIYLYIMQEKFPFLIQLLTAICQMPDPITIEHIICLEGNTSQERSNAGKNLETISALMPLLIAGNHHGYEAYYFYGKMVRDEPQDVFFPYTLLTSSYVINMSADLEHASVSSDPKMLDMYQKLFEKRKRKCKRILVRTESAADIFAHAGTLTAQDDSVYTIGNQPCFGFFDVEAMIPRYIEGEICEEQKVLIETISANRQMYDLLKRVTSYFTKSGVLKFMQEGIVDELPSELCRTIEPKDRKYLLAQLIDAAASGAYEAYLIDEDKIAYPEKLIVTAYSMDSVNLVYMSGNCTQRFRIEENQTMQLLYIFLQDLKNSGFVFGREETLAWLKAVYEESRG